MLWELTGSHALLKGRAMLHVKPGDSLLPIADAVHKAIGYRPSPQTCWRWHKKGVRGRRLKVAIVAGRPRTTTEAVAEFVNGR